MKKILFAITNLEMGGAERVLVDLANKLCETHHITILTLYPGGTLQKRLKKDINVVSIARSNTKASKLKYRLLFKSNLAMARIYKKYVYKKYDTVVAFLEGPMTELVSTHKDMAKKIAWVHTNLLAHYKKEPAKLDNLYQQFDQVVFCSESSKDVMSLKNSIVIPNYIETKHIKKLADEIQVNFSGEATNFICVGRLVKPKAYDRLIRVANLLKQDGYKFKIHIVGNGPEKENIKQAIKSYQLENNIKLLGELENPYPYIKAADYFLLPSSYEGYGLVLVEAMVLNKFILLTDCGSKEVVATYENKYLAENSQEGIYKAMMMALTNKFKLVTTTSSYQNEDIIDQVKNIL